MTPEEFNRFRDRFLNEFDAMERKAKPMPTEFNPAHPLPVPAPQPSLRKAAAEALLAGGLLLSDAQRDSSNWQASAMAKNSEERFRKALEQLAEALAQ